MPSLILIKAPGGSSAGMTYPLATDLVVLGREESCEIVVPNNAVSRKHAQITRSDGKYYIDDLKSRNRTFVNNREINAPTLLKNDDRIKICDFLYRFYDERVVFQAKAPPLPPELTSDFGNSPEDPGGLSTIEHTVAARAANQLLESQPAEKMRVLLDISTGLSKTLDLDPLLEKIAESLLGVYRQADRCFVILIEDDKLISRVVKARRSVPGDDHRFSRTIVRKCLTPPYEAYLSEDAGSDAALGAAQSIAEFRIRSVMCVPLISSDGKPIGALQLDTQDRGKKFREDDLKLTLIVANLASVAIEKARLHAQTVAQEKQQNEIELARQVQLGFLPQSPPDVPGYEFYSVYRAALTVGGDYFDFILLPGGKVAVVLGDVAGKGVPASLLMAKLSAEARFCLLTQPDPVAAVNLLNEQLIRGGIGDRFVTLAAVILDPADHSAVIVNAGHMNPILYRLSDGTFADAVSSSQTGIPLGIMAGFEYEAVRMQLEPGDNLLVFTDGVTDAMAPSGELFQVEGIRSAVNDDSAIGVLPRPKAIGERVFDAVRKHAAGKAQNDDIALVCFGRLDPAAGPMTGG